MKKLKKYIPFFIASIIIGVLFIWDREIGLKAVGTVQTSFKEMIMILPPVFILMGLLDVWVPNDIMVKYMGPDSGITGIVLAILLGSTAAGPLYGAFPIAAVFMKKGVQFKNILIFIGAWSTTKIPLILFELSSLGTKFALTRLMLNIPGILLIAYIINRAIDNDEKEKIYKLVEDMDE